MRFFSLFFSLLFSLTACKSDRISADSYRSRENLEKLGYLFTEDEFLRAINEKQTDIVKLFIDSGMSPDTTFELKNRQIPAIFYAIENDDDMTVQLLIHSKVDLTASVKGVSVLMKAAEKANPQTLSLLIKSGAEIDFKGENGTTPLMVAIERGKSGNAWLLIQSGANLNVGDFSGYTPLMRAVSFGNVDIVRELIKKGANVFALSKKGTPLYKLIGEKNREEIELLLRDAGLKF